MEITEIKLRGQRILVKKDTSLTETSGLKDPNEEEKCYGEVITSNVDDIKAGYTAIFGAFAGDRIQYQNEEYFVLNDEHGDIIGYYG